MEGIRVFREDVQEVIALDLWRRTVRHGPQIVVDEPNTVLSDQGGPFTCTLHGAYYLNARDGRTTEWYPVQLVVDEPGTGMCVWCNSAEFYQLA